MTLGYGGQHNVEGKGPMNRISLLATALLLAVAGRVSAQGPASTTPAAGGQWDPTGVYDAMIRLSPQQQVGARLVLKGTSAKYEGTIAPDGMGEPLAFDSIVVRDRKVTLSFTIPGQGQAAIDLVPAGDSVVGKLTGAAGLADVSARKIR